MKTSKSGASCQNKTVLYSRTFSVSVSLPASLSQRKPWNFCDTIAILGDNKTKMHTSFEFGRSVEWVKVSSKKSQEHKRGFLRDRRHPRPLLFHLSPPLPSLSFFVLMSDLMCEILTCKNAFGHFSSSFVINRPLNFSACDSKTSPFISFT